MKNSKKKSVMKIYDTLADVEKRRGLQKQNVYCVYTRVRGARWNKKFMVLKDKEASTKNRARSIYAQELGVSYPNVSMFMAYNECSNKKQYKLKKDTVYFKK